MSVYLYKCPACEREFEVEKTMADAGNKESCPSCQTEAQRVFTAPGIAIKGSTVKAPAPCGAMADASDCAGGCCGGSCGHH